MSRPLKKPSFDAEQILHDLIAAVMESYESPDDEELEHKPLAAVADEFNITPLKVRKLLLTGGAYETPISAEVSKLYASGKTIAEIQTLLQLSRASVQSYLPYRKGVYNATELSTDAERVKLYRARKDAVVKLTIEPDTELLWQTITLFEGYPFHTAKNLKFTYTVKGNDLLISRKEKSVTRSSVEAAYWRVAELQQVGETIAGPKSLGTFGASYIYPMFVRFGIIK